MKEERTVDISLEGIYINLYCGVIVDVNGKTRKLPSERLAAHLKMSTEEFNGFIQALSTLLAKYEILNDKEYYERERK